MTASNFSVIIFSKYLQSACINLMFRFRFCALKIKNILDCTCGIGIQALSLAQEGFNVTGSDLSQNELDYAKREVCIGV